MRSPRIGTRRKRIVRSMAITAAPLPATVGSGAFARICSSLPAPRPGHIVIHGRRPSTGRPPRQRHAIFTKSSRLSCMRAIQEGSGLRLQCSEERVHSHYQRQLIPLCLTQLPFGIPVRQVIVTPVMTATPERIRLSVSTFDGSRASVGANLSGSPRKDLGSRAGVVARNPFA